MILTRQRASMNPGLLCQSRPSQSLRQSGIRQLDTINGHNLQRKSYTVLNRSSTRLPPVCRSVPSEEEGTAAPQEGWWTKSVPDNIIRVSTVQELVDELAVASRNDELVVLEVFAPWCGACKALFHKMKKLCKEHDDVKFLLLNFEDNRKMAKGLGVKVLPFFHFYRGPSGKVGEMTCSISKINKLKEAIMVHKSPRCYIQDMNDVVLKEYPDITPSNMTTVSSSPPPSPGETLAV